MTVIATVLTTIIECKGKKESVSTVQLPGESDTDFVKRHNQEVAEAEEACGE